MYFLCVNNEKVCEIEQILDLVLKILNVLKFRSFFYHVKNVAE